MISLSLEHWLSDRAFRDHIWPKSWLEAEPSTATTLTTLTSILEATAARKQDTGWSTPEPSPTDGRGILSLGAQSLLATTLGLLPDNNYHDVK